MSSKIIDKIKFLKNLFKKKAIDFIKITLCSYFVITLICIILVSCSSNNNYHKIVLILSTLDNPFFVQLKEGAEDIANVNNIKLVVYNSENEISKEKENVEKLIDKGIDLIIINPVNSETSSSSLELANLKNIPIITVDRTVKSVNVISHITSDNYEGGKMAARLIIRLLDGKGNVAELEGIPGTSVTKERGDGFNDEIKKSESIRIVASQPADFDQDKAKVAMEHILTVHPDINAVFAHNDEMALGALKVIEEQGKEIYVIGFDGTDKAIKAIEEERLTGTIAQQPIKMGRRAMVEAIKFLNGEKIEKVVKIVPVCR